MTFETREGWLNAGVEKLCPLVEEQGYRVPEKLQVAVSWPKGRGEAIGQCFHPNWTHDGTCHLSVSPTLGDDPARVLDVLLHEIGHAVVGTEHGHKTPFRRFMRAVGLEGKPTATVAGDELRPKLEALASELGPYPHSPMSEPERVARGSKRAQVKYVSPTEPDFKVWLTPRLIDEHGVPRDPWGDAMEPAEG